jgi:hypothetical protein
VEQGLTDNMWITDFSGNLALQGARECIALWIAISNVDRAVDRPDKFSWPWDKSGEYSANSTYKQLVQGGAPFRLANAIWKSKATPKSKLFVWLAAQHRIWTADRRFRHGLQTATSPCYVCLQDEDTAEHILVQCVVAREVWFRCRTRLGLNFAIPDAHDTLEEWWIRERSRLGRKPRRELDTLVSTVCHSLWKNRNAWCFDNAPRQLSAAAISDLAVDEFHALSKTRGELHVGGGDRGIT